MIDPNYGFGSGLKDAKIRTAADVTLDIYGVVTAEGSSKRDETEVKGDDQILGSFGSALREDITIEANAVSFDVLAAITGNQVTETTDTSSVLLGTSKELNPVFVEVQAFTQAKFRSGDAAEIKKTWFKVQLNSVTFSQAGEQELKCTFEGTALQTDLDITGAAITGLASGDLAVAKIEIYNPANIVS